MARYLWLALAWTAVWLPGTFATAASPHATISASRRTGCRRSAGIVTSALLCAVGASRSSTSAGSAAECRGAPHSRRNKIKYGVASITLITDSGIWPSAAGAKALQTESATNVASAWAQEGTTAPAAVGPVDSGADVGALPDADGRAAANGWQSHFSKLVKDSNRRHHSGKKSKWPTLYNTYPYNQIEHRDRGSYILRLFEAPSDFAACCGDVHPATRAIRSQRHGIVVNSKRMVLQSLSLLPAGHCILSAQ